MPWGYRSKTSRSFGGGSTSAWNTAGETASLKNACRMYGLTEHQVEAAEPPIPCQWRSCHGNSYAVVKLSDMAALKKRIKEQERENKKKELIDKLGQEAYEKMLADEKAKKEAEAVAAKEKFERDQATSKLVRELETVMRASGGGIADSLDGMTITKTNAKKEWYLQEHDISTLSAVEEGKKTKKFRLADVISTSRRRHSDIASKIANYPERKTLYARYLQDAFEEECKKADYDIVEKAYETVRTKISKSVEEKAAVVKKAQVELEIEQRRLGAFDGIAKRLEKRPAAEDATDKENLGNNSKPATKKAKTGGK